MKIKTTLLLLIFQVWGIGLFAQHFNDLSFGSDETLEVVSWNIEHFPKNGQRTLDYVAQAIQDIDADIIAIQEVEDTIKFKKMISTMPGYKAYFQSSYFAGLAFIYKTASVQVNQFYEIYTASAYWSPFPRSPMIMDFSFKGRDYLLINNHFKCCGNGFLDPNNSKDEENRRAYASRLLKTYIDNNFDQRSVFVVGDFNDVLTDQKQHNVFQVFIDDAAHYRFADMSIAQGDDQDWSFPTWPSHLDHILITAPLFAEMEQTSSRIQTIKLDEYLDGGWREYDRNMSDHRPIALKFIPRIQSGVLAVEQMQIGNYPNPFSMETTISFDVLHQDAELIIYNQNGQEVDLIALQKGQSDVAWKPEGIPEGVYLGKLYSHQGEIACVKLVFIN